MNWYKKIGQSTAKQPISGKPSVDTTDPGYPQKGQCEEKTQDTSGLNKRCIAKLWDDTEVFLVDGNYVRNHADVDWVDGGSGYVYRFIPKNEIWVEQVVNSKDQEAILAHECVEFIFMKYMKKDYNTSHSIATSVENILRQVGRILAENNVEKLL